MPRTLSLKQKRSFDELFKKGRRVYSPHFTLVFTPTREIKFAVIVRKKEIKLAAHRNYSKRILREIIRKEIITLNIRPAYFAILCKWDLKDLAAKTTYQKLSEELIQLFKRTQWNEK